MQIYEIRLMIKERDTQRICYFIYLQLIVVSLRYKNRKNKNGDSAATWTNSGLLCRDEITDKCMGELHRMLNQLGSCSISCLRLTVETERLVRSIILVTTLSSRGRAFNIVRESQ